MKKTGAFFGYFIAVLGVPIILAALIGMGFWGQLMVDATGVEISPWITGGEVARRVSHGSYRTDIHRPIFDGLIGEKKVGFVQVDWAPKEAVPDKVEEDIDFDNDGYADFHVRYDKNRNQADIKAYNEKVIALESCYNLKECYAIRVSLRR